MAKAQVGEGRPYRRKSDGLWVVAVRDVAGKRKYLYGSSPDAVIERRDEYRAGTMMGLDLASTRLTVGRQLEDWLADRRGKVRGSTWISYESHVRIHLASLRHIALVRLRAADVRRLAREREAAGCSPRTIAYSLTILRMAIRQALADGIIPRNVAAGVSGPQIVDDELVILTRDEVRTLIDHRDAGPYGRLWVTLALTGLRLGEALALRSSDIDWARGKLTVNGSLRPIDRRVRQAGEARMQTAPPKTAAGRRTIAVPRAALEALRAEAAVERPTNLAGLIFTTSGGQPIDKRNALKAWVVYRELAKLPPVRIHDLRHTCASLMLASGASLFDVMKHLGHTSISMTAETYGHLVEGRSRELADAMDAVVG